MYKEINNEKYLNRQIAPDPEEPTAYSILDTTHKVIPMPECFVISPIVRMIAKTTFIPENLPQNIYDAWISDPRVNKDNLMNLLEVAGRNCYQSWDNKAGRTNESYLRNIIKSGHLSVLEHGSVSFFITNVSRAFTHELVRHRLASYSQLSQRYVHPDELHFVIPPFFLSYDPESLVVEKYILTPNLDVIRRFCNSCLDSAYAYSTIIKKLWENHEDEDDRTLIRKRILESSRSVLPNATVTSIVMTANLREWRHITALRTSTSADLEMRIVMSEIFRALDLLYHPLFDDIFYEMPVNPHDLRSLSPNTEY